MFHPAESQIAVYTKAGSKHNRAATAALWIMGKGKAANPVCTGDIGLTGSLSRDATWNFSPHRDRGSFKVTTFAENLAYLGSSWKEEHCRTAKGSCLFAVIQTESSTCRRAEPVTAKPFQCSRLPKFPSWQTLFRKSSLSGESLICNDRLSELWPHRLSTCSQSLCLKCFPPTATGGFVKNV